MTAISFREASIRSELPVEELNRLATSGHIKIIHNYFTVLIDSDSLDTYLVNSAKPKQESQEMIVGIKKEDYRMSETIKMPNGTPVDKIKRYDWTIRGKHGSSQNISKDLLKVDLSYQRPTSLQKIRDIQARFNWFAFGRIRISKRRDGTLYVFDGWHRVCAVMNRSDIKTIPCDVYIFDSIEEEAQAFIDCNVNRKPVAVIYKYHAGLISKDKDSLYIDAILRKNKINIRQSLKTPLSFKSIGLCYQMVKDSDVHFEKTIELISELCINDTIHEKLVGGIFYISKNLTTDLGNPKLRKRILSLGPVKLLHAAKEACYEYAAGGQRICAIGMLKAINKGLKIPFKFHEGITE